MAGTLDYDVLHWPGRQPYPDTCAVRCVEFILQRFTGSDFDHDYLVREAYQLGWYVPSTPSTTGGTPFEHVGKQLELHGIPVTRYPPGETNVLHLMHELARGHKVIVGLDAGEIRKADPVLEKLADVAGAEQADHAVVVSGIDTRDPATAYVVVSDPGTGEVAARYPLAEFLDAWRDSRFFLVATALPAPAHLPEMANFNYGLGYWPPAHAPSDDGL